MLTRVLPGGVMVAAALTVPEFSVGAGDMGRGPTPLDPPEPAARPDPATAKRVATSTAPTHPKLTGVRYAPIIDLGTEKARATSGARVEAPPPGLGAKANPRHEAGPARDDFDAAFADLAAPAPSAPLTAPAGNAPVIAAAPASVPSAAPAELGAAPEAPMPPAAAERDAAGFASLLPEEQAALRAPAGTGAALATPSNIQPAPVAAAAPASAPAAAAPASLTAAPTAPAPPAGRSAMEQLTPARIAAAKASAAPAAPPRTASRAITAPAPPKAAAAAPGARAPFAVPAAAKPAPVPAPAPVAAAVAVPRQPAATSAPASAGAQRIADLDFRSRLLTRVDGRAKGQVDFQQTPAGLKVRLGSVAEVLADRIAPADLARIRNSSSGNAWLSLAELQAQGIPISYDPVYDEFNIGRDDTRPKAARKVHMDQISAPERSAGAATMDQIRRR
jgi:hypothetical protein